VLGGRRRSGSIGCRGCLLGLVRRSVRLEGVGANSAMQGRNSCADCAVRHADRARVVAHCRRRARRHLRRRAHPSWSVSYSADLGVSERKSMQLAARGRCRCRSADELTLPNSPVDFRTAEASDKCMDATSPLRRVANAVVRRLTRRRRVPAGTSRGFPPDGRRRRDDGGAGVREPREPRPKPPTAGAVAEPTPDTFLDLPRG
jgi:hypothetical protein